MNKEKTLSVCDLFDLDFFRLAPRRFWLCGDDMFSVECELSMDSALGSLPVDLMYSEAVGDEVHNLTNEVLLPYSVEELDAMSEEQWDGW